MTKRVYFVPFLLVSFAGYWADSAVCGVLRQNGFQIGSFIVPSLLYIALTGIGWAALDRLGWLTIRDERDDQSERMHLPDSR